MQELKAGAFAGNPETLVQFCKADHAGTPSKGLSRAVLVLDAPLVEDKSQVCTATATDKNFRCLRSRTFFLGCMAHCSPKHAA